MSRSDIALAVISQDYEECKELPVAHVDLPADFQHRQSCHSPAPRQCDQAFAGIQTNRSPEATKLE